jgi:acetyl esterase/lipase
MTVACLAFLALQGLARGETVTSGTTLPLWPEGAPGAVGQADTDIPAITVYLADEAIATGAAYVVCPGGGYQGLAPYEGEPIAQWFNTLGVTAFVLRYRLAPTYHYPAPFLDASRAIRYVRARAEDFRIDPARVGILGFSAGGHLASTVGTHFDAGDPDAEDPIDRQSSRPDTMILVYPVISFRQFAHMGSCINLLGDPPSEELMDSLSNETQVTAETPPAFLIASDADTGVPCENSILFALAMRRAGVPVELHVFEPGQHGFGLGQGDEALKLWPELAAQWLRLHGFVDGAPG